MAIIDTNQPKNHGFTIVEMLVVAPIIVLVIGVFISAIVTMTGDALSTKGTNGLAYDVQDALNRINQDVTASGAFLATNSVELVSPQGYNDDTTIFENADATNGTMLILNSYATTTNSYKSAQDIVYLSGQPNSCSSALVYKNKALMLNIVYFVKDGSLWRRVLAPTNYATIGCSVPWQRPSCTPDVSGAICVTDDIKLIENITNFSISYFPSATSTTANTSASNSSIEDNKVRQAALLTTNTVEVTIAASDIVSGRDVSYANKTRATSSNNNISNTPIEDQPITITKQPMDKTVSVGETLITFTADASGTNPTVKWQFSTNLGTSWMDISGQTAKTLTIPSVTNTMDGYMYRAIFTNSKGSVNTAGALLTVNYPQWTEFSLQNNWANFGSTYYTAGYRKTTDGVVILKGLVKNTVGTAVNQVIATLPVSYRPEAKLRYAASSSGTNYGEIEIWPNGEVQFISGSGAWISLDSIRFVPDTGRYKRTYVSTIENGLVNGWTNFAGNYATTSYVKDNSGRVSTQGLVKSGTLTDNTVIFNMPSSLQAGQYMHVAQCSTAFSAIGVGSPSTYPGIVAKGMATNTYLSTQVMYYTQSYTNWTDMTLQNGWLAYGGSFATPQYTKSPDGLVTIKGLIKSGTATNGTVIANLPAGYRPSARVLHIIDSWASAGRVDVEPDGDILFIVGSSGWYSMDGVSFYAEQ